VRLEADGVYADLHYLTRHPLAEMIAEAAERMPEALGLSHNAEGRTTRQGDAEIVEEITRVVSVDLVSDPATTLGLFESLAAAHYDRVLDGRPLADAVSADSGVIRTRSVH
jgi:phenylpyruvate tautomerase PptA (4-oxalocrotonate tautomerase family)